MAKKSVKKNLQKIAPAFSMILSIVLLYLLLAPLFSKALVRDVDNLSGGTLLKASYIDFGNYTYPYSLGLFRLYRAGGQDIEKSIQHFKHALRLDAVHLYSWSGLARAYYLLNEKERAYILFDRILHLNTINRNLAWDAGIFLLTKNEMQRGMSFLTRFLALEPESAGKVFDLFYQFRINTEDIVSISIKNRVELHDLFMRYLVRRKSVDDISTAWRMIPHEDINDPIKLALCNVFMNNEKYGLAKKVWSELMHDRKVSEGIQNGDFEYEIQNGCFDWRRGGAEGMKIDIDRQITYSGGRSIRVAFDGDHNPGVYILRQIVPVWGGERYYLSGFIKSDGVTTTNGVFFKVRGYHCGTFNIRSEVFTGTNPWTGIQMEFGVPDECNSIIILMVREKSRKLNNKIKGRIWVDDIRLTQLRGQHD